MELLGGPLYAVAGAGESHGPGITSIVFGCPPGILIERKRIQRDLDRRRPGSNRHGTPRREDDHVALLSGLYSEDHNALLSGPTLSIHAKSSDQEECSDQEESSDQKADSTSSYETGYSTGEPIAALVLSTSQKSGDYSQFAGAQGEVRPGHTDLVKHHKSHGYVDVRGGGRSSYRSTITDVVGGSIARIILEQIFGTVILSNIVQVGPLHARSTLAEHFATAGVSHVDASRTANVLAQMEQAEIYSLDANFAKEAGNLIKQTRIAGDSIGAVVEVVAVNVPALAGEPLYNSLKLRLIGALGGLNAVQGVEIGAGFAVATRRGSENNDPIRTGGYQSNSHGGLIGGITTGMPIVLRVAFKPTSTITLQQASVRKNLEEIDFQLKKGRHDPCVGVRAGVTLESRVAIELMNAVLMHQAAQITPSSFQLFTPQ